VTSGARVFASIVAVVILGAVFGVLVVDSAGAPDRGSPVAPVPGAVDP
jgi:H+/gluconate symporter-like permease